jgi:hypothetical protein
LEAGSPGSQQAGSFGSWKGTNYQKWLKSLKNLLLFL